MKVMLALDSRLVTVNDITSIGPFFFIDPDLSSEEARSIIEPISTSDRQKILEAVLKRVEPPAEELWDQLDFTAVLHEENTRLGLKPKIFMTVLRHALTGMKRGPGVAESMRVLGRQRTSVRLKTAHPAAFMS